MGLFRQRPMADASLPKPGELASVTHGTQLPAHDEPHKQDDQNDNSHNDNSDLVNGIHGVA